MAVIHGSKADIFLNGYNAGNWFNTVTATASKDLNDSTVLNNAGYKMHYAQMRDAKLTMAGFFDSTADSGLAAMAIAGTDPDTGDYALNKMIQGGVVGGADDIALHFPMSMDVTGNPGYGYYGACTTYGLEGSNSDLIGASVEMTSIVGREYVVTAAPLQSAVNTFTGVTIDNGALTTKGGSAYLMVTDWISGSLPVNIEHSVDGVTWSTLGSFAAVTADYNYQRITFSGTINRYVRAKAAGTYSSTFVVAVHRNT